MSESSDERPFEIHVVEWDALAPHATRDALFLVSNAIGLNAAAEAVRDDRVDDVAAWLADGTLTRPDAAAQAALAERNAVLAFVIVQPWVLAQERRD